MKLVSPDSSLIHMNFFNLQIKYFFHPQVVLQSVENSSIHKYFFNLHMKYFFDLWIKLVLKFYLQILIRSTDWILLLSADLILNCRYFLNLQIKFFLFTKNYLISRSDSKQVISSTSYKSYVFCKTQEKVNSEQRWAN